MAGLGGVASELGIDRFVGDRAVCVGAVGIDGADEEVGDATDALVHERHLEDHVVAGGHRIADPLDPLLERLVAVAIALRHLEHGETLGPVGLEYRRLVLEPLVEQQLGHLAERAAFDHERARVDLVLQGEEVRAVEPRRDLRRCQQPIRHSSQSDRSVRQTLPVPTLHSAPHRRRREHSAVQVRTVSTRTTSRAPCEQRCGRGVRLGYTRSMSGSRVTTMKVTTATRDRLRSLGSDHETLEDVVVAALDVYEAQQFWAAAEAAHAAETTDQRSQRKRIEAEIDDWMDDIR